MKIAGLVLLVVALAGLAMCHPPGKHAEASHEVNYYEDCSGEEDHAACETEKPEATTPLVEEVVPTDPIPASSGSVSVAVKEATPLTTNLVSVIAAKPNKTVPADPTPDMENNATTRDRRKDHHEHYDHHDHDHEHHDDDHDHGHHDYDDDHDQDMSHTTDFSAVLSHSAKVANKVPAPTTTTTTTTTTPAPTTTTTTTTTPAPTPSPTPAATQGNHVDHSDLHGSHEGGHGWGHVGSSHAHGHDHDHDEDYHHES